jgi:large subunit ribosomal protein L22
MEINAKNNYLRIPPRKTRAVCDLIRDMEIEEALIQLENSTKKAARPVKKLLESAIANAENNHDLDRSQLEIKEIKADKGPTLKRWQPRAFGRATPINKRTSNLEIILTPETEVKPQAKKETPQEELETKDEAPTKKKTFSQRNREKKESQKPGAKESKKDSFFKRKSI